jgi:hypothetical protein
MVIATLFKARLLTWAALYLEARRHWRQVLRTAVPGGDRVRDVAKARQRHRQPINRYFSPRTKVLRRPLGANR